MSDSTKTHTIEELIMLIGEATKQVTEDYLRVENKYPLSQIVREKVFCYELYQQLRNKLGVSDEMTVNYSEYDKERPWEYMGKAGYINSDFVFHVPGSKPDEIIIMEVEGLINKDGIFKDFSKIQSFVSKDHYGAGVFLLYNHSLRELVEGMDHRMNPFCGSEGMERIYIITLPQAHGVEKVIKFSDLEGVKHSERESNFKPINLRTLFLYYLLFVSSYLICSLLFLSLIGDRDKTRDYIGIMWMTAQLPMGMTLLKLNERSSLLKELKFYIINFACVFLLVIIAIISEKHYGFIKIMEFSTGVKLRNTIHSNSLFYDCYESIFYALLTGAIILLVFNLFNNQNNQSMKRKTKPILLILGAIMILALYFLLTK